MIAASALIIVATVLGLPSDTRLVDCASRFLERQPLENALRIEPATADVQLRIHLPSCDSADTIRLEVIGPDGSTRTATVGLQDVPLRFRYRTIAHVTADLATRKAKPGFSVAVPKSPFQGSGDSVFIPATRSGPAVVDARPRGGLSSGSIAVGAVVRPDVQPDSTIAAAPFIHAYLDWPLTDRWQLRLTTNHEFNSNPSVWHYGGRLGLGPSCTLLERAVFLDATVQYNAGVIVMQGRGEGAGPTILAPAHGPVLDFNLGIPISKAWSVELLAGVGFEWGVEGWRNREPLVSTHGLFGRAGLAFAFHPSDGP